MATASGPHQESPENDVFYSTSSGSESRIQELEQTVEKASDLLIYRDFEKCLSHCSAAIHKIKGTSGYQVYVDSLSILMIQAFAELDNWDTVLPFIQDTYGSIERCPVRIIQLCLLLHVKVKEYIRCHTIARMWLQSDHNRRHHDYCEVAKLYVNHVLVPLGALNLIPQFVDTCTGLSDTDKEMLLSPVKTSHSFAKFPSSGETNQTEEDSPESEEEERENKRKSTSVTHQEKTDLMERHIPGLELLRSMRRIGRKLMQRMARFRLTPACRVMILVTLAALAIVNSFNKENAYKSPKEDVYSIDLKPLQVT